MTGIKKPHCKAPSHLHVAVTPSGHVDRVTAHYEVTMQCENHVSSWGVLLNLRANQPTTGMHLLPEAVVWLPGQLQSAADAAAPGQTVTITHTSQKVFVHFASLSVDGARVLADAITAAGAQHP